MPTTSSLQRGGFSASFWDGSTTISKPIYPSAIFAGALCCISTPPRKASSFGSTSPTPSTTGIRGSEADQAQPRRHARHHHVRPDPARPRSTVARQSDRHRDEEKEAQQGFEGRRSKETGSPHSIAAPQRAGSPEARTTCTDTSSGSLLSSTPRGLRISSKSTRWAQRSTSCARTSRLIAKFVLRPHAQKLRFTR